MWRPRAGHVDKTARDLGQPLKAGQVVLSGALGPMAPVKAGDVVTADITELGSVTACFGPAVRPPLPQEVTPHRYDTEKP